FPLCRIRTMKQGPLQRVISRLRPLVVCVLRLTYPLGRRPVRREPSMESGGSSRRHVGLAGPTGKKPTLCRSRTWVGRGRARLFSVPSNEGMGAARGRGRRKTPRQSARHATSFRFRVSRCPARGGPVVADGVAPGSAGGCSCEPHPRVPHPVPPSRRLMRAPLSGRDPYNLG